MSSKRWCMHSMQAHRRLVLLVDLLAMGPLNPDESVRHDGGAFAVKQASHAALLREYGQPAQALRILFISCLASSPESSAVAAGGGHLFLLACGCLVAQRCHARRLDPELSLRPSTIHALLSPKGHSRYPHGISTPTACLPASQPALCLAHRYHCERNAMPGHCMRAEKHLRVVPCTPRPPFVPVC